MTTAGNAELVRRLRAEEDRMQRLWDACEEARAKHVGTPAAFDFNGLKHAVAGRDPVLLESAAALEATASPVVTDAMVEGFRSAVHFVRNNAMNMERDYPEIIEAEAAFALSAALTAPPARTLDELGLEIALEDAAKSAFVKAQSVYRADHDHFPLKSTWETTSEDVREGWRAISYAAVEAAWMPPLGTQPEPRQPRNIQSSVAPPARGQVEVMALRDQVARIIDPHSFLDIPFTEEQVLLDMVEQSKQDALRKADRILSALTSPAEPAPASGGE